MGSYQQMHVRGIVRNKRPQMADKNDKPVANFRILQSVEDYIEKSGRFRTKCASFNIPGRDSDGPRIYVPYCHKQRFDLGHRLNEYRGDGVFTPPENGKPWKITDSILFREHFHDIHCPQGCRGYRNKTVAAILNKLRPRIPVAAKWTRKEIVTAILLPVVLCLAGALLGWLTPEGRRLLHLDKSVGNGNVSGSIVNNGGVLNNPTINNNVPPATGVYELTDERRDRFLKSLSVMATPRDTLRIGCTAWSEASCVAAGRFLLLLSQAGWQIEENKVFRLEPQIPIVGVSIATHTPAAEPKQPLPPHLGRWRLMDESHKTIYWAFRSIDLPVAGSSDNTLKEGTLGIYFGSEPK
jgi:hypothetical protein